ncbi:nucleoside diphosphate-linked moiety X motif 8 [Cephus cinctus]|uniref:Nucleoside diphosphate-linked moiety X motif 8 n=1 Tax=Cephus cinctus TaxID=211228 RepID=A0AAJ7BZV7_CEPCN|nr:nucleoside diphosphate-linked moiety X motif 8 [Cephus cinctus]
MASYGSRTLSRQLFLRHFALESHTSLSAIHVAALRPEVVLSSENRKSCVRNLKQYLQPRRVIQENASKAAVLVPLCIHKGELGLLYTLRSTKLNTNRGQVSFPGGMHDKNDSSLEETALRETWEELKIPQDKIDIWTSGNPIGRKDVTVFPVLGFVGEIDLDNLQLNPEEVEEAFVLSLKKLCDPASCHFTQFRNTYSLPSYTGGKHRVWGLTAAITHMVMCSLVPGIYKHRILYLQSIGQINSS